jgi:hypothetical protein
MPYIDETWLKKAFDALKETLAVDVRMRDDMIAALIDEGFWSKELEPTAAIAKWNACLNPNKGEFFRTGELWFLMRRFGRHQLFLEMAQDLGYHCIPLPTETRRQAVLERIAAAQEKANSEVTTALAELERLNTLEPRPNYSPGHQFPKPFFSLPDNDNSAVSRLGCV